MSTPIDWTFIVMVTVVGFLFVVILLFAMVGIMKVFGLAFTIKRNKTKPEKMSLRDEEIAAISTALALYQSKLHDRAIEVVTIHKIKSTYSPWNSKIHGLTQIPERQSRLK